MSWKIIHIWLAKEKQLYKICHKCLSQSKTNFFTVRRYNSCQYLQANRLSSSIRQSNVLLHSFPLLRTNNMMSEARYCTDSQNKDNVTEPTITKRQKFKQAIKDYGATVIIFHVAISLMSLGLSYLVISSGVDVESLLEKVGLKSPNLLATGASTFVVSYALHKVFAPVRISITLGCTPFIVQYLRRVGVLKPPKPSA